MRYLLLAPQTLRIPLLPPILLLAICMPVSAEIWPDLSRYVDSCALIVKARTVVEEDGVLAFRVLESWKGRYDPAGFSRTTADGRFLASRGEHGVEVADGQEIVFFFTRKGRDDSGRHGAHSTAFPIRPDGKLTYASTGEQPREFTVAGFKRAILRRSSPRGLYPFAISPCARYRLRIVDQERRVEDGQPDRMSLRFDLEIIDPTDPSKALPWKPAELLFEMVDPLALARTTRGEDLASAPHVPGWGVRSGWLALHSFEVPRAVERLAELAIECELIRVTGSDELVFEDLELGESDLLQCGAFELGVMGATDQVTVSCAAYGFYEADHQAFRKRVPIRALHHRWAIAALGLTDAEGHRLIETSGGGTGGASTAHYRRVGRGPETTPITYPVTLRLRMPRTFARERLRFGFTDLRLGRLWPAGGTELVYRIGKDKRSELLDVIRRRLAESGPDHVELALAGDDRLVLRINTQDKERLSEVKALITTPGSLEFRITVEPGAPFHQRFWTRFQTTGERTVEPDTLTGKARERYPRGVRWHRIAKDFKAPFVERTVADAEGARWLLVALDEHDITGADIEQIDCHRDTQGLDATWVIAFAIRKPRRADMAALTGQGGNRERHMAMIFDDEVLSAPVLRDTISDQAMVSGDFTEEEARARAALLRAGALDIRPVLLSERPTGPDPGAR